MTAPTTVQAAIDLFQVAFDGISGIQSAPADPPDRPDAFPFITTYAIRLRTFTNTPEDFRALWTLRVDLFVGLTGLPESIQALLTFPETVLNAMHSVIKTNAIPCDIQSVEGEYVSLTWGGIECVGFSYYIRDVKIVTTIT